jgi:signal transduction histidine kinase
MSLLGEGNLSSEQHDMVRIAQTCGKYNLQNYISEFTGEQLLTLINDILDLSKMEEQKLVLVFPLFCVVDESKERTPFSLHDIIEGSLEFVSFQAAEKQIDLICDMDDNLPDRVIGDAVRVRQILVNLLNNAIKFSNKNSSEVVVRAAEVQEPNEEILSVLISVEDQGIGISNEAKQKLFQRFSQADTSVTRKFGGGLAEID